LPFGILGKRLVVETTAIDKGCRSARGNGGLMTEDETMEVEELVLVVSELDREGLILALFKTTTISAKVINKVASDNVGQAKKGFLMEAEKRVSIKERK
jgi:hypothetical protein